jgi:hypothetical protein
MSNQAINAIWLLFDTLAHNRTCHVTQLLKIANI